MALNRRFAPRAHLWTLSVLVLALECCVPAGLSSPPATPAADCCAGPGTIILEEGWRFRTDPDDQGVIEGWYLPDFDDDGWEVLTPGEPWELSGVTYDGMAWYRAEVPLPDWPAIYLGFGGVDDAATLWANGEEVATWESAAGHVVVDLLDLGNPGDEIQLTFRVHDRGGYGGIKQPLRLASERRAAMTDTQYVAWLADSHPEWPMPGWARGRPLAWTMAGRMGESNETLLSSDGAVAPWADGPTVEAWLYDPTTGEVARGAGNDVRFSLVEQSLPIPQWEWAAWGVAVAQVLFQDARQDAVRWILTVRDTSDEDHDLRLLLVVRPFGINRASSPICAAGFREGTRLWINGAPFLIAAEQPERAGVGLLEEAMAVATEGRVPAERVVPCARRGDAVAVLSYPLDLDAGQTAELQFALPSASGNQFPPINVDAQARLAETVASWEEATGRVVLDLPDDRVERSVRASLGYLLLALDAEGPHPGPLAHDSLWVRDAAYVGLALLQTGYADAVRSYIPAVLDAQETSGRVPPIQGADIPWDYEEWDAQGEAIFLVTSYYRYTNDRDTLQEWYPALRAAASFIVDLRAGQIDTEGSVQGLLPPSRSAEDLGLQRRHYYWDNYWAVAGLEEAAYAARELGEDQDAEWMESEADALRGAILSSVEAVMGAEPAYIPVAVGDLEGSAMARGTVPALWPVEVLPRQTALLERSFDYYYQQWIEPYAGGFRHRQGQFWPYGGLELAHAYLRLGRTDVVHQILSWTLDHQTLPGTFAWAEQVDPDRFSFSGGDMPHAWAAADLVTLVREMLVSERGGALELFNGVPGWWLETGQT
ncbi:MAG: hypothetical protein PVH62_10765, partial [Anaerolineae bacterium]